MNRFDLPDCEHVRMWAALAPDGELAELERRALRAHVLQCGSCARFAHGVEHISMLLRAEALEQPSFSPLIPRVARRRQALVARARTVSAAAAVALMALGIASRAPLEVDGRDSLARTTAAAVSTAGAQRERDSLRALLHVDVRPLERPLERPASLGRYLPV